jgi:hypothetical protein
MDRYNIPHIIACYPADQLEFDMAYTHGICLPSRKINFRVGLDTDQSHESKKWFSRYGKGMERCAIAINTYYPEVNGGYYNNRSLIALVQDALAELGYKVVLPDSFQKEGLVPVEERGCLLDREEYVVADGNQQIVGRILLWQYDVGGATSFYSDKQIMDFALLPGLVNNLENSLRKMCSKYSVTFQRD